VAVLTLVAAGLVMGPGVRPAHADPAQVIISANGHWGSSYSDTYSSGGEFDVHVVSWDGNAPYTTQVATYNQNYNTGWDTQFSSFCIQSYQTYYPGRTYYVELADATDHTTEVPLENSVKYLFHAWNRHQLDGYNYDDQKTDAAGRMASANKLQRVLWKLQGCAAGAIDDDQAQGWYDMALANASVGKALDVKVMRLYSTWSAAQGFGGDGQDELVEVTPEPTTLALLAIGALPVLPIIRRRRPLP